ncbi:aspartic peptidase domain-containing protein [Xylariomycetidae sp. FL2044]|nr:aspartic peptidase domain-containing protein [Xylariomycetidae sp. FL2044]
MCVAGFPDGFPPRPPISVATSSLEENRTNRTGRHIKATLQPEHVRPRRCYNGTSSPPRQPTNGASRILPQWEREGAPYELLKLGMPQQKILLILDTGSYTMLVDPDCARAADGDASQSETGYMEGLWYNDTVFIGKDSLPLTDPRVGVSTWSDYLWAGILGVSLVSAGYVEVPSFSLGVRTQAGGGHGLEYWANITSLSVTPPGQAEAILTDDDFQIMMLVDCGSTYTYIDVKLVNIIAQALNAYVDTQDVYHVSCDSKDLDGCADFIIDFETYRALGVQPAAAGEAIWVFKTSFMRAAYVVFDQQNDAVWLAQHAPCGDGNGDDDVADLTWDAARELWLDVTGLC